MEVVLQSRYRWDDQGYGGRWSGSPTAHLWEGRMKEEESVVFALLLQPEVECRVVKGTCVVRQSVKWQRYDADGPRFTPSMDMYARTRTHLSFTIRMEGTERGREQEIIAVRQKQESGLVSKRLFRTSITKTWFRRTACDVSIFKAWHASLGWHDLEAAQEA